MFSCIIKTAIMPLISVIIPAFNAESNILNAINSVLQQTHKNVEVLVIDDGSTDNTSDIIKSFGEKITYFYQSNQGVAKARNKGIDMAKGKYITFLDADDYLEPYFIEDLLIHSQSSNSDIIVGNMYLENESKKRLTVFDFKKDVKIELKEKSDYKSGFKIVGNSSCAKLFKRSIIGETRFTKLKLGEDALFTLEILLKSKCIAVDKTPHYVYVQNPTSVTHKKVTQEVVENYIKVNYQKRELINKYGYLKELNGVLNDYYIYNFLMFANIIRKRSDNNKGEHWDRWLMVNRNDFVKKSFAISLSCFISRNINWVFYTGMLFTGKFYQPLYKRISNLHYYKN